MTVYTLTQFEKDKIEELCNIITENATKGPKSKVDMDLNLILDYHYTTMLQNFVEVSKYHIEQLQKKKLKGVDLYVEIIHYLASMQDSIDYHKDFYTFIEKVSQYGDFNSTLLEKALTRDIKVIFANAVGNIQKNEKYFDIILSSFYPYMSNTLFRNFVVIYINMYIKLSDEQHIEEIQPFMLDLLSNNRKISTVVSVKGMEKGVNIIFPVLATLLDKVHIKGSSLFSNQFRFYGYRQIKFYNQKEQSVDTQELNLMEDDSTSSYIDEDYDPFGFRKVKGYKSVMKQLNTLFGDAELSNNTIKQNICDIMVTSFGGKRQKIEKFISEMKIKDPDKVDRLLYYVADILYADSLTIEKIDSEE